MVDFFVVFCLGVCMGIVIQGFRDKNAFKGHYWRLNHTRKNLHDSIVECNRLEDKLAGVEEELNEFSEEETQRFWDKLLGFEKNYGGKDHG